MYLVNRFNRVVLIDDEAQAEDKLKSGRMRQAKPHEIAAFLAGRETREIAEGGVYFMTVNSSPNGYGMSRDHLKKELKKHDVKLVESYANQKVGLLYDYPYSVMQMRNDVRLIYTMFESDKIPEDWPDYLHEADEVLVPSKFCQDAFAKRDIQSTVVPLGYNQDLFKYQERDFSDTEPFTFVHYNSFNVRKGFIEVFNAFTEEFTKEDNVKLILKTVHQTTPLPILKSEFPQIEVITGQMDEADLVKMLGQSHCMVYPSRGEGFGITPLEAMATGIPAIVPNAHGISEYFNANYMLEVKVAEECPALYKRFSGQDVGNMVVCDVEDLKRQMRHAYEHRADMKRLGQAASEYAKNYTYAHTAERLAEIIKRWESEEVAHRKDSKYLRVEKM